MGYGELGGNGSIQNAVWLSEPDVQVTQLTKGPEAWQRLKESQLSRRARAFIPRIEGTDLTFYGRTTHWRRWGISGSGSASRTRARSGRLQLHSRRPSGRGS